MQALSVSLPHKSTFFYVILGLSGSVTCILLLSSILHQQLQVEELNFPKIEVTLPKTPIEIPPLVLPKPVMIQEEPPISYPKIAPPLPTKSSKPNKPSKPNKSNHSSAAKNSSSRPSVFTGVPSVQQTPQVALLSNSGSSEDDSPHENSSDESLSNNEGSTNSNHSTDSTGNKPVVLKHKVVPAILIRKDKISTNDDPHLPEIIKAQRRFSQVTGTYKICIATNGSISSVDTISSIPGADEQIMQTLKGWRYRPQAIPICFIQFLEFKIE